MSQKSKRAKVWSIYGDTSVFGGVWDEEFSVASREFFSQAREGFFNIHISPLVELELRSAPSKVRAVFTHHAPYIGKINTSDESQMLRDAYMGAGIVSRASLADAFHVALASASGCDIIVSWNFRHIVHHGKIGMYNAINVLQGFKEIAILSPREVIRYEDED